LSTPRYFARTPYDREILGLAAAALGSLAAEPLYILVDTAIVGHLGRPELAALGIAAIVLTGLFALFNFLAYGTTSQVARAVGAGRRETADRLGAQAFWLSLGIGAALAGALAVFAVVPILTARARRLDDALTVRASRALLILLGLQLALGAGSFVARFSSVWIPGEQLTMLALPVAHRLAGSLILAATVVVAIRVVAGAARQPAAVPLAAHAGMRGAR
jgi:Na+-driven multidrug efflux pump